MESWLLTHYSWILSLHVISVIAWMAGLFYLPRLFVYHASAVKGSELSETLKIMERRLLRIIMTPAMISSWFFGGLMLLCRPELFQEGWMHIKLTAILGMTALHHVFALWRKDFEADRNTGTPRLFRLWNEAPTVLMIVIVMMAILKPSFG